MKKVADEGGRQHNCRSGRVREAVSGGGLHRLGGDGPADGTVEAVHPQLDQDGRRQNGRGQPGEVQFLRVDQLFHGALSQFKPHEQNGHGHHEPGQVLHSPVAEGVLLVGGLSRQPESHQRNHR